MALALPIIPRSADHIAETRGRMMEQVTALTERGIRLDDPLAQVGQTCFYLGLPRRRRPAAPAGRRPPVRDRLPRTDPGPRRSGAPPRRPRPCRLRVPVLAPAHHRQAQPRPDPNPRPPPLPRHPVHHAPSGRRHAHGPGGLRRPRRRAAGRAGRRPPPDRRRAAGRAVLRRHRHVGADLLPGPCPARPAAVPDLGPSRHHRHRQPPPLPELRRHGADGA